MNTMTKLVSGAALAAALVLPLAAPVAAGEKSDDLVVRPVDAMDEWQKETTRDLNRALAFAPGATKVRPDNGIVQMTFTLGANGKAENIKLYNSSANLMAERIARRAVRKLDNLDQVPVRDKSEVKFLANMIFADNEDIKERLMAKLEKSENARLARANADGDYVSFGI